MNREIRIEEWSPFRWGALGSFRLVGKSYGDPRRTPGTKVITSRVVSAEGNKVTTESGSVYTLGTPHGHTKDIFSSAGIVFHPEAPFGFLPGSKVV